MTKVHYVIYGLSFILCSLAYWPARQFIIQQEPFGDIVVSNLTANYVLMFCLVGGLSPWLTQKLFPRAPKWLSIIVTALGVLMIIELMKLFGYAMRW